jgi:hypothetical protein
MRREGEIICKTAQRNWDLREGRGRVDFMGAAEKGGMKNEFGEGWIGRG